MKRIYSSDVVQVRNGVFAGQRGFVDGIFEVKPLPIKVVFYSGAVQFFSARELRLVC